MEIAKFGIPIVWKLVVMTQSTAFLQNANRMMAQDQAHHLPDVTGMPLWGVLAGGTGPRPGSRWYKAI